ncbi:acetate kinase [Filimonas lacunae]|uniref:Acetate kinase n=1 Tax=Filimonas lacunae TaxID=477680 RepID=A0A173MJW9_9BACT|nr:acetate/propionate family kinase [Filimonas lacunae]BAV07894.1 acetate kinase [Filimonas lacunae]SIT06115.1 acetate kinase [Filimonas lacunae]
MSNTLKWILVINCGSSSIKFGLYDYKQITLRVKGVIKGIGHKSHFSVTGQHDKAIADEHITLQNHEAALLHLVGWLQQVGYEHQLLAVGHRIVQGGLHHTAPQRYTQQLKTDLEQLIPLAPLHLPLELLAIHFFEKRYPRLIQVCCFDTAFHQAMPWYAQQYALPEAVTADGIKRYGFHGLSYDYIMQHLHPAGKTIIAHLGNGASMAAMDEGKNIDTTMGFTPAGGLMMGTRCGDIDPGVLLYLLQEKHYTAEQLSTLINKESGLKGVSGLSSDMEQLLEDAADNKQADAAITLFCYQAKKNLGALAAALGGLQTLIFTGGIGEHHPAIRERICQNMAYLGLVLDKNRNTENAPVISHLASSVTVRVIPTDEEYMIATYTAHLLKG